MAKRISKRTYNPYLYGRRNYFLLGGDSRSGGVMPFDFTTAAYHDYRGNPELTAQFVKDANANGISIDPNNLPGSLGGGSIAQTANLGTKLKNFASSQLGGAVIGAAAGAVGGIANKAISGDFSTGAGAGISGIGSTVGSAVSAFNPLIGGAITLGSNLVGGLVNRAFGHTVDKAGQERLKRYSDNLGTLQLDDSSNGALSSQLSSVSFGGANLDRKKYRNGWFNKKGTRAYKNDILKESAATSRGIAAINNAITNADTNMDQNIMANYAAYGGPIGGIDALGYMLATDSMYSRNQAMQAGNSTGLYMQPTYRQLPTFSRGGLLTARRRAFGGELNTQGGDFTNGMIYIDNGGSHESNPYEGVPMGMDEQGVPNLVEEGETIFNDYVFSKRLNVPKAIRDKYKLRGTKSMTFAEVSKKMAKESEERPNDPISARGLEAMLSDLAMAQESIRAKEQARQFSEGGRLYAVGSKLKSWKEKLPGKRAEWLRYTPAVGLGIGAITDALGWTNKPDYGNADARLEASRGAGTYQPVEFRPVGNYLAYEPLDTQFPLNQMNAQSGSTRSGIINTSGGNRGAAITGLLAADNNFLNQVGNLTRQAVESNAAQRAKVEEFNRGTNEFNSEGFLKAGMANQNALTQSRELNLKGTMTAYDMRERARLASEQAKANNLSGFLTALGDIGRENVAWNQMRGNAAAGVFGNMTDWYKWMEGLGSKPEGSTTTTASKGGKIKRRKKGLTC